MQLKIFRFSALSLAVSAGLILSAQGSFATEGQETDETAEPDPSPNEVVPVAPIVQESPEQMIRSRRFFFDGMIGVSGATNTPGAKSTDTPGFGTNLGIGFGYKLLQEFSLAGFYHKAYTLSDGLISWNIYAKTLFGLEAGAVLLDRGKFSVHLGLRGGRASVTGLNTVLLLPYGISSYDNWGAGPKLDLLWRSGKTMASGIEFSYFQVAGGSYDVGTLASSQTTGEVKTFGIYDVSFMMRFYLK